MVVFIQRSFSLLYCFFSLNVYCILCCLFDRHMFWRLTVIWVTSKHCCVTPVYIQPPTCCKPWHRVMSGVSSALGSTSTALLRDVEQRRKRSSDNGIAQNGCYWVVIAGETINRKKTLCKTLSDERMLNLPYCRKPEIGEKKKAR